MGKLSSDGDFDEYFLPDLIKGYEEDVGFIVEIERILNHINSLEKIYSKFKGNYKDLHSEWLCFAKDDTEITMIFNIMASQVREALHLFNKFKKTKLWEEWEEWIEQNEPIEAFAKRRLNLFLKGYGSPKECSEPRERFQKDILGELRNRVFHYDPKKAKDWFHFMTKKLKNASGDELKFSSFINTKKPLIGLGKRYDTYLYSKYLIFGNGEYILESQKNMMIIKNSFRELENSMSKFLIEKNGK